MDVDWIIAKSKEILFEIGEFPPCIFVEMDHADPIIIGVPQIHEVDHALDRARITFYAGRAFAQKAKKKLKTQKVTSACLVAEIWYVNEPSVEDMLKYGRPTNHPRRKDGLSFATIDVPTMQQALEVYEILHPAPGQIDLLKDSWMTEKSMESGIGGIALPAFLAGVRTAKQDISLAIHEYRRICERYNAQIQEALKAQH